MGEVVRHCCKVRRWDWGGLRRLSEELSSEESASRDEPKRWAKREVHW